MSTKIITLILSKILSLILEPKLLGLDRTFLKGIICLNNEHWNFNNS